MAFQDLVNKEIQKRKIRSSKFDSTLPGQQRVDELIGSREDLLNEFIDNIDVASGINALTDPAILNPFKAGHQISSQADMLLKGAGGVVQRAEAAITNPLSTLQRGDITENLIEEFSKGLSGEKLSEFGDLIRASGFEIKGPKILGKEIGLSNESISSIVGFMATVGLGNFLTKGKLFQGANKVKSSISRTARRKAVKSTRKQKFFFKEKADEFADGVDDAFTGMRAEFDDMYNKIGNNAISGDDAVDLQDVATRLPDDIVKKLEKAASTRGEFSKVGEFRTVLDKNINTAREIKTAIGRRVRKQVWSGLEQADDIERQLIDDYFKLNDIIANNAGSASNKAELLRLNARFKSLHDFNKGIKPLLKKPSGVTKTTIRNIHSKASQGDLKTMEKFSNKFFKKGRQILKDIDKQNKINQAKKIGLNVAIRLGTVGAGAGLLSALLGGRQTNIDRFIE